LANTPTVETNAVRSLTFGRNGTKVPQVILHLHNMRRIEKNPVELDRIQVKRFPHLICDGSGELVDVFQVRRDVTCGFCPLGDSHFLPTQVESEPVELVSGLREVNARPLTHWKFRSTTTTIPRLTRIRACAFPNHRNPLLRSTGLETHEALGLVREPVTRTHLLKSYESEEQRGMLWTRKRG